MPSTTPDDINRTRATGGERHDGWPPFWRGWCAYDPVIELLLLLAGGAAAVVEQASTDTTAPNHSSFDREER